MCVMNDRNLTLLTDFYELTMGNGYLENGLADTVCCFDLYFRKVPDNGGFAANTVRKIRSAAPLPHMICSG